MTSTPSNYQNFQQQKKSIEDFFETEEGVTIPPQVEKSVPFTNPETGAVYRYKETSRTIDAAGNEIPAYTKRSWTFVPHDTEVDIDAFDPDSGNIMVDTDDAFMVFVYNNNDLTDKSNGWYSITDKKRSYDTMILQLAPSPDKLAVIGAESGFIISDDISDVPPGIFLQQGFMYFNTSDSNLYIWSGEVDENNNPDGDSLDPVNGGWIQVTSKPANPNDTDLSGETKYSELLTRLEALEEYYANNP